MNFSPGRALAALAALCLLAGCTLVAPVRTLPTWVRGVYIPMVENESFEPGLEDSATRAIQMAFLQDGRVDIVPRRDADLILKGRILEWSSQVSNTSNDEIATNREIVMTVALQLYEPLNEETPLADLGVLKIRDQYYEDVRSVDFVPEPRRRERLMDQLGFRAVETVINGFPTQLQFAPPGALVPETQDPNAVDPDKPLRPRNEAEIGG